MEGDWNQFDIEYYEGHYEKYLSFYKNINKSALRSMQEVIKKGIFKCGFKERLDLLNYLNLALSRAYDVPCPELVVVCGKLRPEHKKVRKNKIYIDDNLGVIYFLTRFRTCLLLLRKQKLYEDLEDEATKWSFSLLYYSYPSLFKKVFGKIISTKIKEENKIQKESYEKKLEDLEKSNLEKKREKQTIGEKNIPLSKRLNKILNLGFYNLFGVDGGIGVMGEIEGIRTNPFVFRG